MFYNISVKLLKIKSLFTTFLLLFLLAFLPKSVLAASIINDNDIGSNMIPEIPEPYKNVTLRLSSYITDLDKAMIEWRSGSTLLLSGYGKTSYSFKTQGPGKAITVDATIRVEGSGDIITKHFYINPSEIELLWQSVDGYTPPFYKGKSFPSSGSKIRIVAVASNGTVQSGKKNIVYNWKNADKVVPSASGYGKNSYTFTDDEYTDNKDISVNASSVDNTYNATGDLTVSIVNPKVLFYKKSPTDGILFNQALTDNSFVSEDEFTILAAPFYSTFTNDDGSFTYKWKINGKNIDTPSNKTELTIRPSSRGGYATINLIIENMSALFQKAVGSLKLNL